MKQITRNRKPLAVLLALCLAMQLCVPAAMASGRLMRAGDMAIEQIEEEEGFRAEKYSAGGKWYIGYGTECGEEDFPDGVTREEAELLLMSKVERYEEKLNDFFDRYDVSPTQGQFDALICFSYNFGTGWMSGTSALVKIARGEIDATRLEVAQAFGEWCHSGGQAQAGLADRRLQEAAISLMTIPVRQRMSLPTLSSTRKAVYPTRRILLFMRSVNPMSRSPRWKSSVTALLAL